MRFLFSSIGKKIQIAFSGILLCIFLLFHLGNNLTLFLGSNVFNSMVAMLESIKPFIRVMEVSLLGILLLHICNAAYLTKKNQEKLLSKYESGLLNDTSSLNSRTMILSGTAILLFIIFHLSYIWYSYQIHTTGYDNHTYYSILLQNKFGFLGHRLTAILYIIGIILIASHLRHGFQSALKTFGIVKDSKLHFLYNLSALFWGIIPIGFIVIILCIQLGVIK